MKLTSRDLSLMAIYCAMFYALDYLANLLPFFKMPYGGTLGLGVIALLLASYHLGWKKALPVMVVCIFLQFMTGTMYIVHPIQFVLDYGLAFMVYALASCLPKYYGIGVTNVVRYLAHVVSGVVFFGEYATGPVWQYSLIYNGWYMVPTMILGLIVVPVLVSRLKLRS
jgi:thiamine transporter